jgi:hypothetical protein
MIWCGADGLAGNCTTAVPGMGAGCLAGPESNAAAMPAAVLNLPCGCFANARLSTPQSVSLICLGREGLLFIILAETVPTSFPGNACCPLMHS